MIVDYLKPSLVYRCDNLTASVATLRAKIDNPVSGLDDIQIVLNNHNGVAVITQAVQNVQ